MFALTGLRRRSLANKLSVHLSRVVYFFFSLSLNLTLVTPLPVGKSDEHMSLPSAFVTGAPAFNYFSVVRKKKTKKP